MKNPFDLNKDDEEFVAAAKDAKLRETKIAMLCKSRIYISVAWLGVSVIVFRQVMRDSEVDWWLWLWMPIVFFYTDLRIKFLKATRD